MPEPTRKHQTWGDRLAALSTEATESQKAADRARAGVDQAAFELLSVLQDVAGIVTEGCENTPRATLRDIKSLLQREGFIRKPDIDTGNF